MTPRIIGHRGAPADLPENTLEGIAHALTAGAAGVEVDVHITADGAVVVTHDFALNPDLARDATGQPVAPDQWIHAMTLAELAHIDVGTPRQGSRVAAAFPGQRPVPGARIPTLAAVLDLCAAHDPAPDLLIEVKSDPTDRRLAAAAHRCTHAICELLHGHAMADRAFIHAFDWAILALTADIAPWLRRSHLTIAHGPDATADPGSAWRDGADGPIPRAIAARGGTAWAPHYRDLTAAAVAEAHAAGLQVMTWTVNAPSDIAAMADLGVDAIITDAPAAPLGAGPRRA